MTKLDYCKIKKNVCYVCMGPYVLACMCMYLCILSMYVYASVHVFMCRGEHGAEEGSQFRGGLISQQENFLW